MKTIEYDKKNNIKPDLEITYKTVEGLRLPMQIYYPSSKNKYNNIAVLCVHGGGWRGGAMTVNRKWDGGMMVHQAKYYAMQGFIGVAISYRSLEIPGIDVSDLYEDCCDAIRCLKQTVPSVKSIIAMGDSAGGHLVSCLGIENDDFIRPDIVVALNPVLDCTRKKWCYSSESADTRLRFSPLKTKIEKASKFLIMHGDADPTVEIEDSIKFNDILNGLGMDSEIIILPGVMHAFILYDYKSSDDEVLSYMRMIDEYLERTL